ncbi:ATP phosphoribosyltransferase regulatory subunit [Peribacillus deserti]|uniref:ATP phosphoribosyltransferase regulatory subunit n=1 Tax=Peribacillus deserti TaxID=673318 RepID=A0ABS2QCS8_9BACI|nr:ATP phosphoribosyltransferase regulatory subunit [Peribacillus deserti]MBM7690966.1 ATP phosphoribosyltransferase regulatory subunit [Peribacillus deserti]
MSMPFMFEKPLGMRDSLPLLYERKKAVRLSVSSEFEAWGYQFIETPALEYYETIGEASSIQNQQMFKLLDQQGDTVVLRPDMTAPIARVAASKLLKQQVPARIAYSANVYRAQQKEGGRAAEFEQIGIENIGDGTISADSEVISLLISSLKKAGFNKFQISIGHIGFIQQLMLDILGREDRVSLLSNYLIERNYVGYRDHINSLALANIDKQRLIDILALKGKENILEKASALLENNRGTDKLNELAQLLQQLKEYGTEQYVSLDLTLMNTISYYSGLVFEVYTEGVNFPVGNGGRYNSLLKKFGRDTPATGFALRVDRLIEAMGPLREKAEIECVIFTPERKQEALVFVNERRAAGDRMVMQDLNGVTDLDSFTKNYSEVHYFIGAPGKDETP